MNTRRKLATITPAEAKARKFWALTTPYRLHNDHNSIVTEMNRLESAGTKVVLVRASQPGTAEIWRDGTEYTSKRPYDADIQLCRERMGWA